MTPTKPSKEKRSNPRKGERVSKNKVVEIHIYVHQYPSFIIAQPSPTTTPPYVEPTTTPNYTCEVKT